MTAHYDLIPLAELHLDLRNDRIGEAEDEAEATARMFDEDAVHLQALAEHVLTHGMNMATPLCLIPMDSGGYTVVDGNRRLVTLRALDDPCVIPSHHPAAITAFTRYHSRGISLPTELPCVVYDTREEADLWIDLIHGGPGKGEGTVAWSSEAKANRNRRRKGTRQYGHETWLWIRRTFKNDSTIKPLINEAKSMQYTFMDRLAKVDRFRDVLGLTLTSEGMSTRKKPQEIAPLVEKLLRDIVDGKINAKTRHTVDDIRNYVDETLLPLLAEQQPLDIKISHTNETARRNSVAHHVDTTPAKEPPSTTDDTEDPMEQATSYPAPTNPPHGISERTRLFSDVSFNAFSPKINALGHQAQKISISSNPETCGILCRVIIDLSTIDFLTRHGSDPNKLNDTHLWKRIRKTLTRLDPTTAQTNCTNKALRDIYTACDQGQHGLSVIQLHTFVHDVLKTRTGNEVDHFNQLFTPMLVAMEKSLSQPARPVATEG